MITEEGTAMLYVEPRPAALAAFAEALAVDVSMLSQPLAMLNLLRYRTQAAYPQGSTQVACSGREAYAQYTKQALPRIQAAGGRVLFHAPAWLSLIGPEDEAWDDVFIVEYPNAQAFLQMVEDPAYQAIIPHRQAALADSRLVALKLPGVENAKV